MNAARRGGRLWPGAPEGWPHTAVGDRPWAWLAPARAAPPSGTTPAHKGGACGHSAHRSYARGAAAPVRPLGQRHPLGRWCCVPLDEGRRGELWHPF
ncbi:hypothetical protein GW17_00030356 [Ensete ventricosum]|nr:hypothetical protein GW17_00030356 [Ensete ventricosum]